MNTRLNLLAANLVAGAVQTVRALNAYGRHFNHPGWKPLG